MMFINLSFSELKAATHKNKNTTFPNKNKLNLIFSSLFQVIQSGSSAGLQNKHQPVKQYVTRKNYVAYRGKSVKMWCVFGGTPLPEIRYCGVV